jgi:phosphopantetheinyl transferase (holo-ACP synthase)
MVGNDVVDLADRETALHAMHPRFDQRVFGAEELSWVGRHGHTARWMLWAAKESAYKAAKKLDPRTCFSPRRFLVRLGDERIGTVRFGDRVFSVQVGIEAGACHAVAWTLSSLSPVVVSGVRPLDGDEPWPRYAARRFAIDALAAFLGVARSELDFVKYGRVPRLLLRGKPQPGDVSLSHHGRFVAFAYGLAPRV